MKSVLCPLLLACDSSWNVGISASSVFLLFLRRTDRRNALPACVRALNPEKVSPLGGVRPGDLRLRSFQSLYVSHLISETFLVQYRGIYHDLRVCHHHAAESAEASQRDVLHTCMFLHTAL